MSALPNERQRAPTIFWFALLVAGQAASLALIHAGRIVSYQHYAIDALWSTTPRRIALAVLLVQAGTVLWGLRHAWRDLAAWRRAHLPLPWAGALLAVLAVLSVAPSLAVDKYVTEMALAFGIQLVALGNVVCLARSTPRRVVAWWQTVSDRLLGSERDDRPVPARFFDRTALLAAGWTLCVALVLVIVAYQRIPHLPDEIVYLLHARYFAAGQLALPAPPVPQAFDIDLMYLDANRWFSPVPPGWPALLAVGAAARVAWLVNPVLAALAVLLTHAVLREIYSPRVARGATLLLAVSPWLLFLGMSFMTHVATLVFALAAALGVARARRTRAAWPALVGGLALGVVSLIRPLEGLAVALVLGVWSLGARGKRWRLTPSVALVVGAVLAGALVRPYNAALTGSASRFPIMMYVNKYYAPGANDLGFGANRGLGWGALDPFPGHGLRDVVVNALLNTFTINVELFGWVTGSLCVVALLITLRRLSRGDWWMLAAAFVVAGIHSFYWFSGGPDFAARYWFLIIVPLCALTASGVRRLSPDTAARARVSLGIAALSASAVLTFLPWRASDKYWHFRRMEPGIAQLAATRGMTGAIVLVRGPRHPDYHAAAIFNPLDLRADRTIFAWDRSRSVREQVVRAYPDRSVWFVDGPSVTRRGYEVSAGPLPPGSLAPELQPTDELESLTSRERKR